jgi:hypothetical protein
VSANATSLTVQTLANISTLNVYTSANVLVMNVTSLFAGTLNTTGVSNLATTNVTTMNASSFFSSSLNVTGASNTLSLVAGSNIGIGAAPGTTNLYVLGNAFFTNALTTSNIFTTNVNVSGTSNITTLLATSNIGIGTVTGTTNLYVQGNVFVSNALVTTNIIAGNLLYGRDLTKSYPHLLPTVANSGLIQNWISTTINAASRPASYWSTSNIPVYGNVVAGAKGNSDYFGSVLLPDGRVLFVPSSASNVGFYNPSNGTLTTVSPRGLGNDAAKFRGGVLVPNGNVVFVPWAYSNVGLFDPINYRYSNIAVGAQAAGAGQRFQGGVLSPTGNVVMIPKDSANIGVFNPTTLAFTNVGPINAGGADSFAGGVLLPNGNVVMSPCSSANIGMYNTYSLAASGFSNVGPVKASPIVGTYETAVLTATGNVVFAPCYVSGTYKGNVIVYNPSFVSSPIATGGYSNVQIFNSATNYLYTGAALLPTGNVVFPPLDSANIGMFNPTTLSFSNLGPAFTAGVGKFCGCTLLPDGRLVFCPSGVSNVGILNTLTPAPPEFCLSPYFNKY